METDGIFFLPTQLWVCVSHLLQQGEVRLLSQLAVQQGVGVRRVR